MRFVWEDANKAHLARHGIEPWFAEKIFREGQNTIVNSRFESRYMMEATIRERHYRLVFEELENNQGIYIVTAFQLKKRTI
ncbi:MAG: hypothetical protein FWG02_06980 [Holophagaceae bacterium]|nr:hypothetical protein [Holophagaceae bacterium]